MELRNQIMKILNGRSELIYPDLNIAKFYLDKKNHE